jgi:hypothetical protein
MCPIHYARSSLAPTVRYLRELVLRTGSSIRKFVDYSLRSL